jgi:hypothetical protein
MTAAAMYADQYWHLYRSEFRNTLIYVYKSHKTYCPPTSFT